MNYNNPNKITKKELKQMNKTLSPEMKKAGMQFEDPFESQRPKFKKEYKAEFWSPPVSRMTWHKLHKLKRILKQLMPWIFLIVFFGMLIQANAQAQKDFNAWENEPMQEEPIRNITNCPNGDSIPKDDPKCGLEQTNAPEPQKQANLTKETESTQCK